MNAPLINIAINPVNAVPMDVTPTTTMEMCGLGLACLIDIRQAFELEIKGEIPRATHIPFFNVKQFFGFQLSEDEQEILDADEPNDLDIRSFIKAINTLKQSRDCTFLIVCNSGKRSVCATKLLRELGYPKTFSVQGGFIALKPLLPMPGVSA
ncbi:rhodanese-like domain-containing protein [Thiothrix subterranea]|uniref:rhodanese-like domain-containing protein n=1 Tax=Thiothrix subterranea TaxID=2735563 RepID=UPI00192ADD07|nr:rhodanese-like domain-containing protein [Thiothrix subterranea]